MHKLVRSLKIVTGVKLYVANMFFFFEIMKGIILVFLTRCCKLNIHNYIIRNKDSPVPQIQRNSVMNRR